jgi:hypothetical protein
VQADLKDVLSEMRQVAKLLWSHLRNVRIQIESTYVHMNIYVNKSWMSGHQSCTITFLQWLLVVLVGWDFIFVVFELRGKKVNSIYLKHHKQHTLLCKTERQSLQSQYRILLLKDRLACDYVRVIFILGGHYCLMVKRS